MESQRTKQIQANQGVVKRGILQFFRMIIFIGVAFWITQWLLVNEYFTLADLYRSGVPTEVPPLVLQLGIALVITFIFQILYFILYLWISPAGRKRTGQASHDGSEPDQYGNWSS